MAARPPGGYIGVDVFFAITTTVFARTLWPYLARRVDRLLEGA